MTVKTKSKHISNRVNLVLLSKHFLPIRALQNLCTFYCRKILWRIGEKNCSVRDLYLMKVFSIVERVCKLSRCNGLFCIEWKNTDIKNIIYKDFYTLSEKRSSNSFLLYIYYRYHNTIRIHKYIYIWFYIDLKNLTRVAKPTTIK